MSIILLILGLIAFVALVVIHEYGHYKAARASGVEVEEFGIGFPPKIWSKKLKNKTLLTINALPLGGFVKLKGEHDADTAKGSYGAATMPNKIKIMVAGVIMNLLVAIGLLGILAIIGMPKVVENQFTFTPDTKVIKNDVLIGYVEKNSPAANAGIELRDQIISMAKVGEPQQLVTEKEGFSDRTKAFAGQTVDVQTRRANGDIETKTVQFRTEQEVAASQNEKEPKGYFGIVPTEYTLQRSTWSAPIVAVATAGQFTGLTLQGIGTALGNVFTGQGGKAAEQVAGPVGIFVLLKDGSALGINFMLMIVAIISLTLAIMNVLPIPALDGGRLFVTLLFSWAKKPLKPDLEDKIHGFGFMALMALFVLITVIDVRRLL